MAAGLALSAEVEPAARTAPDAIDGVIHLIAESPTPALDDNRDQSTSVRSEEINLRGRRAAADRKDHPGAGAGGAA